MTARDVSRSAADAAMVQRVQRRLMKTIAEESTRHHDFMAAGSGRWESFLPGIDRKVLHESEGIMSYLLKFEPGAVLPAHRHPVDEECVVLQGTLRVGDLVLPAGSFHKVRRKVLDPATTSDDGAVIYLRGAPPQREHLL